MVDENNRLCNKPKHFYEKEVQLQPILAPDGSIQKVQIMFMQSASCSNLTIY